MPQAIDDLVRTRAVSASDKLVFAEMDSRGRVVDTRLLGQLLERAERIGAALAERLQPGSRVFLMGPSSLELVDCAFACAFARMVPVRVEGTNVAAVGTAKAALASGAEMRRARITLSAVEGLSHLPVLSKNAKPRKQLMLTAHPDDSFFYPLSHRQMLARARTWADRRGIEQGASVACWQEIGSMPWWMHALAAMDRTAFVLQGPAVDHRSRNAWLATIRRLGLSHASEDVTGLRMALEA